MTIVPNRLFPTRLLTVLKENLTCRPLRRTLRRTGHVCSARWATRWFESNLSSGFWILAVLFWILVFVRIWIWADATVIGYIVTNWMFPFGTGYTWWTWSRGNLEIFSREYQVNSEASRQNLPALISWYTDSLSIFFHLFWILGQKNAVSSGELPCVGHETS